MSPPMSLMPLSGADEPDELFFAAVRKRLFWLLLAVFFCASLGIGSLIVHFISMLTDAELAPTQVDRVAGLTGLTIIVSRIVSGALLDRVSAPRVAATLFAIAATGCMALATADASVAPAAAAMVGFAMGAQVDLIGYLVARYFGMSGYGVIYGCQYSAFLIGTALGPLFAGILFDALGQYSPALYMSGTALGMAALLSMGLPPPRPSLQQAFVNIGPGPVGS